MKLQDILEYDDMVNMDDDIRGNVIKNPLPNVISMEDPFFGEAYDAMDEAVYKFVFQDASQEEMYNSLPPREKANMVKEMRDHLTQPKTLPISQLISTEPTIDKSHLDALKAGSTQHKGNAFVFKYKNKNVIADGNHRVIAAFFNGDKNVTVDFLDVDAISLK